MEVHPWRMWTKFGFIPPIVSEVEDSQRFAIFQPIRSHSSNFGWRARSPYKILEENHQSQEPHAKLDQMWMLYSTDGLLLKNHMPNWTKCGCYTPLMVFFSRTTCQINNIHIWSNLACGSWEEDHQWSITSTFGPIWPNGSWEEDQTVKS
jgi:hypothetical protein